ncbi:MULTISPECIES: hypothetical protein [unclassified Aureimonas]|uniref:hypothetical protein n=1 Tax=unclassified Aureimonas TaxID=2615206 RepID=UPI0006F4C8EA|nr:MULTISPECIES: hypothetical protein [unclassified Aureimonas]KQT69038.1 hypothetical protein ASG54_05135 [Aureimonas sp. Leaf460]KQT69273.1 hypothetical protein ASG62_17745 [Aureimonas sp. Leaf427]
MRNFIAGTIVAVAALATSGSAFAACATGSPDAITSKPAAGQAAAEGGQNQAAMESKGIAEDGQHTPLETDPNAPGVTTAPGGTTTNTEKAEAEIAAADTTTTGSTTADAGTASADPACVN